MMDEGISFGSSARRQHPLGKIRQEAALRRWQLAEIAAEEHVQPGDRRPCAASGLRRPLRSCLEGGDLEVDALHVAQHVLQEHPQVLQDVRLPGAGAAVQQPHQWLPGLSAGAARVHQVVFDQHPLHDQLQELVLLVVEAASYFRAVEPPLQQSFGHQPHRPGRGSVAAAVQSGPRFGQLGAPLVPRGSCGQQHLFRIGDLLAVDHSRVRGLCRALRRICFGGPFRQPDVSGQLHHSDGEVVLLAGGGGCLLRGARVVGLGRFFLGAGPSHPRLGRFFQVLLAEVADHVLQALAVGRQVVVRLQLPGKAVHEGVVQDVAPELFRRETVVGVLPDAAQGLAPVGRVRRLELA